MRVLPSLSCKKVFRMALTFIFILIPACSDEDTSNTPGTGHAVPVTPATMEAYFIANSTIPVALTSIFSTIINQLNGTPDASINCIDRGHGIFEGTAGIDLNMDGTDDFTLHGSATLTDLMFKEAGRQLEADYTLSGITGSNLNITGYGSVTIVGGTEIPTIFLLSPGAFTITHTDGSEIQITDMGLQIDLTFPNAPYLGGYICFRAAGGGSEMEAEVLFVPDDPGGWKMQVEGDSWEFDVPRAR